MAIVKISGFLLGVTIIYLALGVKTMMLIDTVAIYLMEEYSLSPVLAVAFPTLPAVGVVLLVRQFIVHVVSKKGKV